MSAPVAKSDSSPFLPMGMLAPAIAALATPVDAGVCTAAQVEVLSLKAACTREQGGCAVLQAISLCAVHRLPMPTWLGEEFVRRYARVKNAELATWDQAFGPFWPARTRLHTERRKLLLRKRVHAAVWSLIEAQPDRPINRILFDEVGELAGIHLCGSEAEKRYYEALSAGALNVNQWRRIHQLGNSAVPR